MKRLISRLGQILSLQPRDGEILNTELIMSPGITGTIKTDTGLNFNRINDINFAFASTPKSKSTQKQEVVSVHGYKIINTTKQLEKYEIAYVLNTDDGRFIRSIEILALKPGKSHLASASLIIYDLENNLSDCYMAASTFLNILESKEKIDLHAQSVR